MRLFGDLDIGDDVDEKLKELGLQGEVVESEEEWVDSLEPDSDQESNDIGPAGEVYASSESSGVSEDSQMAYIPRATLRAFKETHGKRLRAKKDTLRFTDKTKPFERDRLNFVLSEATTCPSFMPMTSEDV